MASGHTRIAGKVRFGEDFELDLRAYVAKGWKVVEPKLYFHPDDRDGHELCANRVRVPPDPPGEVDPAGVWRWDLEYVKEGVIDIVWDLEEPEAPHA